MHTSTPASRHRSIVGCSWRGSWPAPKPHVDRPLDLGRIAPDFSTVSLEDLALVAPLTEIGKGRVPVLRKPSDDPERASFAVATDRDRRMRTLDRLRLTPGVGQREVLSGEVRPRLGQQRDDDLYAFLELIHPLFERWQTDTERVGLVLVPAGTEPDDQSTPADDVGGCRDVGQHGRVSVRHASDLAAKTDPRRCCRHRSKHRPPLETWTAAVGEDRFEMVEVPSALEDLELVCGPPHREHRVPAGIHRCCLQSKAHPEQRIPIQPAATLHDNADEYRASRCMTDATTIA